MKQLTIWAVSCLFAVTVSAQELPLEVMAEVVKTPLASTQVLAPGTQGWFSLTRNDAARIRAALPASAEPRREAVAGPGVVDPADRRAQCEEARVFVTARIAADPDSDIMLTKLAVVDACYEPPAGAVVPLAAPQLPTADQSKTPLQTASGVPLDLSQRVLFALTLIAVNTAKEAVVNEGLGAFANQICDDPHLATYFRTTCNVLVVGEVTKNGTNVPLRTFTLKQIGTELQEATRADMDEAVPMLIGDLAMQLNDDQRKVLPLVRAVIDTLRTGSSTFKGATLARNVLLNLDCASMQGPDADRCAILTLLATASAASLDPVCTDAASCEKTLRDIIAADALRRLQEWGARNDLVIPLPAPGQPFEVATLTSIPAADLQRLKDSPAYKSLVLWNDKTAFFSQTVFTELTKHVAKNKPSTPTVTGYVRLIESSLGLLEQHGVPAAEVNIVRTTLGKVNPRIFSAIDMALVAYRAAQSLRRGNNALAVVREAALETPCERDFLNDFTCGFRFGGVVLASVVHVEETLPQGLDLTKPADRDRFIALITADLQRRLALPEHVGAEKWATDRFLAYNTDYATFARTILDPILTLEASMKELRDLDTGATADRAAIERASIQVVDDAFALLKTPFTTLPLEPCVRNQIVRVLDDVGRGWLGVQKSDYKEIISAVISLGADLRIESPVIDTIIAYRPLIEAFTAAETTEEFKATVENFMDVAPTAVEMQQFARSSALSIYVGGIAGAVSSREDDETRRVAGSFAPYVPVGIDLALNQWGAMISLLDVGAVATLYVREGESKVPDARLSNVFSPGIVVRRSLSGKPYAWGISASVVPDLGDSGGRAPRVGVFFAYQRPLLRIAPIGRMVTSRRVITPACP